MNDKTYTDEHNEPATFAEQDHLEALAAERKTAECGMCLESFDPDDLVERYFYHDGERHTLNMCSGCCNRWDHKSNGYYDTCIVCRAGCVSLGDDSVAVLGLALQHGKFNRLIMGALCAECCAAWGIQL